MPLAQAERLGDRRRDECRIAHRGERDEDDAIRERRFRGGGRGQGEAGLADAPRTGEGQQARSWAHEGLDEVGHRLVAADQRVCGPRQRPAAHGRRRRAGHWSGVVLDRHATSHQVSVERTGVRHRWDTEFLHQRLAALGKLAQGAWPVTGRRIEPHEPAVDLLGGVIDCQVVLGQRDGVGIGTAGRFDIDQGGEDVQVPVLPP